MIYYYLSLPMINKISKKAAIAMCFLSGLSFADANTEQHPKEYAHNEADNDNEADNEEDNEYDGNEESGAYKINSIAAGTIAIVSGLCGIAFIWNLPWADKSAAPETKVPAEPAASAPAAAD